MIEVEVRRYSRGVSELAAQLRVDDAGNLEAGGDTEVTDRILSIPVLHRDPRTDEIRQLRSAGQPEEWLRQLHTALRGGRLIAVTIHDST